MADEVVHVPGGTNNNNYANVNLICEIAERLQVDAVMPMWGHASENPSLPTNLKKIKRKVTFIGPPAAPMQALGDKIGSTIIAQSAGVPVIGWNGDSLRCDYKNEGGIPDSVYAQANVTTAEDALECANRIGYPVMIKASEGGGGKGIRKVTKSEDVISLFRQVQGEIPGSPIFVMKMASGARHIEVQLLADQHGDAIALSGRDCSVQRRHQKIIEEGPPNAVSDTVRAHMEAAAVALAKTVGYANAGTVEYLFMEDTEEFAFLELNPRLQVEHPVTENILGLNLPSCQVQVAMGIPLHRIGDIRKLYNRHVRGRDTIDFEFTQQVRPERHCIAVRVTAENPESGFQPTSGDIRELNFRSAVDVWGYFSVNSSSKIHEFADSQFGHIFASGKDRNSARRAMIVALKELEIRGDIRTTIEYIVKLLQSEDFATNKIDTMWLDGRIAQHAALEEAERHLVPDDELVALCGTALEGFSFFKDRDETFVSMLKVGQVPNKGLLAQSTEVNLIYRNIKYTSSVTLKGPTCADIDCNGESQEVISQPLADGGFLLTIAGRNYLTYATRDGSGAMRMILNGHTCIFPPEYDPTRLVSSVAGKVARLLVQDGAHLKVGDPFVEIEVMKMYMPLKAQEDGIIQFQMSEGATLSPGDVIATVSLDHPDKVVMSEKFNKTLIRNWAIEKKESLAHVELRETMTRLEGVLAGYFMTGTELDTLLNTFMECQMNPMLPVYEMDDALSVLKGRIDMDLFSNIDKKLREYEANTQVAFPAVEILSLIHQFSMSQPTTARAAFNAQMQAVWDASERQIYPANTRIVATLLRFLEAYLNVERSFDSFSFTDVVGDLRKTYSDDLTKVLSLCRSTINLESKNEFIMRVIELLKNVKAPSSFQKPRNVPLRNEATFNIRNLKARLTDLSKLRQSSYSHIAFTANLLLMEQYTMTAEHRREKVGEAINAALISGAVGEDDRLTHIKKFAESNIAIRDLIIESMRLDPDYQIAFIELYLRKVYQKTHVLGNMSTGIGLQGEGEGETGAWVKFDFVMRSPVGSDASRIRTSDGSMMKRNSSFDSMTGFHDAAVYSDSDSEDIGSNRNDDFVGGTSKVGTPKQTGIFATVESFEDLNHLFSPILSQIPEPVHTSVLKGSRGDNNLNVAYIVIMSALQENDGQLGQDEAASKISAFLRTPDAQTTLKSRGIRRVTFLVGSSMPSGTIDIPTIYTFREAANWVEDRLYRHIEAPQAFLLDLQRLSNFTITLEDGIQTSSGNVHLYKAEAPDTKGKGVTTRYFARLVSFTAADTTESFETLFIESLDQLALVIGKAASANTTLASANHIFMNIVAPDAVVTPDYYENELRRICTRYSQKLVRLGVAHVELKLTCRLKQDAEPMFMRFVASNPTGFVLKINRYYEAFSEGRLIFKSLDAKDAGEWDNIPITTPYPIAEKFEKQRAQALASTDTLYVYDWPVLFKQAVSDAWFEYARVKARGKAKVTIPDGATLFQCTELVLCHTSSVREGNPCPLDEGWDAWQAVSDDYSTLVPLTRDAGKNNAGMVAWLITMCTPEYPQGREVVIIANDITYQAGSFGTKEDVMFHKASRFARARGIPRLYLAANSGARIGMAQSLKTKFDVCWSDASDPVKGFKYVYVTSSEYDNALAKVKGDVTKLPFITTKLDDAVIGTHYRIDDIIGEEQDLGVENLMGSGLIAGETSRAYDDIFTLTLVVGRTVGIGAYLVRLGQRTIQKTRQSPIILTGFQALNKLMGREIYTTNDQLGGPMIMYPNGVTHLLAPTHLGVVSSALEWLSFVPHTKNASLPVLDISGIDSIDRPVTFVPEKGIPYDPRYLLEGVYQSAGSSLDKNIDGESWLGGFFDRNSFVEVLGGWAKTVVTGRARLGGIPMGVIVTENRTAEALKPADPADNESQERMVQQAGGVWFPDSAYKTAQALKDFNREGLPCMVFANWRGFSGGQRDMFLEVLKFGSMIVDALVDYNQPIFVYIPPFAELRGGAWVVVDSTINSDIMEFYAAENSRGGVLEAAGAASIKFRSKDVLATAHRLDTTLKSLVSERDAISDKKSDTYIQVSDKIMKREKILMGVYSQVAVHFADLHDTPGRMKAKNVIRSQVDWKESRKFFYWRLKRRLTEMDLTKNVKELLPNKSTKEIDDSFKTWFISKTNDINLFNDDKKLLGWIEDHSNDVQSWLASLRDGALVLKLSDCFAKMAATNNVDASIINNAINSMKDESQRNAIKNALSSVL